MWKESICIQRGERRWVFICLGFLNTKGNYQKELADMYHILCDGSKDITRRSKQIFQNRMKESLDQNGDPFRFQTGSTKISDILDLSAQKGEVLKYQIRQQMQYEAAGDILKNLTKKIRAGEEPEK